MRDIHVADAQVERFAHLALVAGVGVDREPGGVVALHRFGAGQRDGFLLALILGQKGGDRRLFDHHGLVQAEFGDGLHDCRVGIGRRFVLIALNAQRARHLEHFLQLALGAGQRA